MPRYEYASGTSNKFWEITRDGSTVTTRYGRIGAAGQQQRHVLGHLHRLWQRRDAA